MRMSLAAAFLQAAIACVATSAVAATYSLPTALGSGVFASCNPTTYVCTSNLDFGNDNGVVIDITTPMTLVLTNGNFQAKNNMVIDNHGHAFTLQLNNGNFQVGNNFNGSLNIVANNGNVQIENNGNVYGNVSASGNIELDNNTTVHGVCNKKNVGRGTCSGVAAPLAAIGYWRLEEAIWNGTAGEVKDSSGYAHDGRTIGVPKPSPLDSAPARPGNPGTCGYGDFPGPINNGGAIEINGLPVSMAPGAKTTVAFWMYWNGSNSVMPIGWNRHDLWLVNGNFGFNTSNSDVYGIASSGLANRWVHVVAVFSNGAVTRNALYIDGVRQTLSQRKSTPINSLAYVQPTLRISGWQQDNGYRFSSRIDEVKVFNGEVLAGQVSSLYNETHACASAVTPPAALNAVDVGANAVTGQITTKTAGAPFNLDIYALNAARTAQDSRASGDVLVDLLANTASGVALDGNNCPLTFTVLPVGTVTLSAGKATASIGALADSWRDVRARMRYPATGAASVTACSADNFALKPAALSALASHADWETAGTARALANRAASGGELHKAGRPFTLRVTGYNAGNVITGNYDGSPEASIACLLPASGCVLGTLTPGAFSAAGGTVSSHTANYGEVGAIAASFVDRTYAAVDSDDTAASCAGYHVCANAIDIGRFVPDHFDIAHANAAFLPSCGSFTYLGQPFAFGTPPVWTLSARNSQGGLTQNYSGSLFKLAAGSVTGQAWSAASGSVAPVAALPAVSVADLGGGLASLTFSVGNAAAGGGLAFDRTLVAPFDASLALSASVQDSEGVAPASNPYQQSGIGFDDGNAATGNDARMRFGRLRLLNAVGSELLPLPMPLIAQTWNGQGYVGNGEDNCTAIATPVLTFFLQTADNRLDAGDTTASFNATLVAGNGNLRFSAPGAGNYGFMDVSLAAPAWLRVNRDGTDQGGDGNLFDDDPSARAAFGRRRSSEGIILRREVY